MLKLVLIITSLLLSSPLMAFSYMIEVTEAQLQQRVSKMMPLVKKKYFLTVTLTEPKVELLANHNKIAVFSNIKISALGGIKGKGTIKINGSLIYVSDKYEFYLKDPVIESLEIEKIPAKFLPKVKKLLQQLASKALIKRPIYTLKNDNLKHKLAKSMLKTITIKNKILYVELGF